MKNVKNKDDNSSTISNMCYNGIVGRSYFSGKFKNTSVFDVKAYANSFTDIVDNNLTNQDNLF
ncbi:MAG: hypothetical protein ACRCW0_06575 [Clostridium sp.]